jgi:DNA-binding transcriptional LysR family regulator
MELRDIEIFLILAEELHFGRAAQRLYVSQARVSQVIKQQERRLGGALFDRSNRRQTKLTPLGSQLHSELKPAYTGLRDSLERARLAARGISGVLRVGMLPSNAHELRPYWDTFRTRHPQWELRIRHNPYVDAFAPLRNGDIDVLVAWLPIEEPDLTVGPGIFAEDMVTLVPPDHRLAGRGSVSVEDLGDFTIPKVPGMPDYWEEGFAPFRTRRGRPIERDSSLHTALDDLFTLVGNGESISLLGAHAARYHARPDIVYLPVRDSWTLRWALVWRSDTENDLVRAFAQTVRDLGPAAVSPVSSPTPA